jgi:hypothetical protein
MRCACRRSLLPSRTWPRADSSRHRPRGRQEIDAALKVAGIEEAGRWAARTDEPTLEVVVSVLAGAVNTRFVAR